MRASEFIIIDDILRPLAPARVLWVLWHAREHRSQTACAQQSV
jgi:hypothetical protein